MIAGAEVPASIVNGLLFSREKGKGEVCLKELTEKQLDLVRKGFMN